MKYVKILFLNLGLLMLYFPVAYAKTQNEVQELISRHLDASGGVEALMSMRSITRVGNIYFINDQEEYQLCYRTDLIYPNMLREQLKEEAIFIDRGTDGQTFWLWTGHEYETTQDPGIIAYMVSTAERANRDMVWILDEAEQYQITDTPTWAPQKSACIKEIAPQDETNRTYCFDPQSGLVNVYGSDDHHRILSDWRSVSNVKIPFYLSDYENGKQRMKIQLEYALLNLTFMETHFQKPDAPQAGCVTMY